MRKLGLALSFLAALGLLCVEGIRPLHAENTVGPSNRIFCNKVATMAVGPSAITQVVAAVSGQSVNICGWSVTNTGATGTFSISYGTGSNCGTGTTVIIPPLNITSTAPATDHVSDAWFTAPTGNAVCITPSVATIAVVLYYAQF